MADRFAAVEAAALRQPGDAGIRPAIGGADARLAIDNARPALIGARRARASARAGNDVANPRCA